MFDVCNNIDDSKVYPLQRFRLCDYNKKIVVRIPHKNTGSDFVLKYNENTSVALSIF